VQDGSQSCFAFASARRGIWSAGSSKIIDPAYLADLRHEVYRFIVGHDCCVEKEHESTKRSDGEVLETDHEALCASPGRAQAHLQRAPDETRYCMMEDDAVDLL
jgi:hypothetical protein